MRKAHYSLGSQKLIIKSYRLLFQISGAANLYYIISLSLEAQETSHRINNVDINNFSEKLA